MKKMRIVFISLILAILAFGLIACGAEEEESGSGSDSLSSGTYSEESGRPGNEEEDSSDESVSSGESWEVTLPKDEF